ncbi:MAG: Rrf2 family transcriptional regulator [Planctomycetaceae bacterium]|nr:Rrf2 family transcriptional regulator [Planctomycetaceae bacterium]
MRYTTKAEYGIIALLSIANAPEGRPCSAKDIASAENMSLEYVEKLLHKLKQFGLVQSHRGASGGFTLATEPKNITLKHIIEALDGATFQTFCIDEVRENIVCNHLSACGLGDIWGGLKGVIDDYLSKITLESLRREHSEKQVGAAG